MQFTTAFVATIAALAAATSAAPTKRTNSGTGTWFTQNGNAGSCGSVSSDSDMIVAVSSEHHSSSNCGKTITISRNGVEQTATIVDECPGCSYNSLDMSTGLFQKFAGLDVGELDITWWANW